MAGGGEFASAMAALVARVEAASKEIATKGAMLVEAAAKKRAPVRSGTLRRSVITKDLGSGGVGIYSTEVGPTVIYARRVALGFHGPDSLGRVYHQAGNDYWGPAVSETATGFHDLAAATWAAAIGG